MKGLRSIFQLYKDAKTEEQANALADFAKMIAMYHIALKRQGFRGRTLDALTISYQESMVARAFDSREDAEAK